MQIYNLEFTEQEVREAVAVDRLLSMEIEFSRLCAHRRLSGLGPHLLSAGA